MSLRGRLVKSGALRKPACHGYYHWTPPRRRQFRVSAHWHFSRFNVSQRSAFRLPRKLLKTHKMLGRLYGIALNQGYTYFRSYPRDKGFLKALVSPASGI